MNRIFTIILLATMSCMLTSAKLANNTDKIKVLEDKFTLLQNKQGNVENHLNWLNKEKTSIKSNRLAMRMPD